MNALVIIDYQNDFLPGGPLGVPGGDEIVDPINRLIDGADLVVASQDWHPASHGSFASNHTGTKPFETIEWNGMEQTLWPDHCVQGTTGADFAAGLNWNRVEAIFRKGTDPQIDSYSAFFDNGHKRSTGLSGYLKSMNVTDVVVVGLATDFCVKFTALDAIAEGFRTIVPLETCRGVDLNEGDVETALKEVTTAGAIVEDSFSFA